MALNIKDPEADRLARELAAETGETITEAVSTALQERLERMRGRTTAASLVDELAAIAARSSERLVIDRRSPEEILGYDDRGLPN